jgi:large subunit ribosomal protein L6
MTPDVQIVAVKDGKANVTAKADVIPRFASRMTGTVRSHLNNAVNGVTRATSRGSSSRAPATRPSSRASASRSPSVCRTRSVYEVPKGLAVQVIPGDSKNTVLLLETADKDLLGQVVAQLQSFRPPEPYKGKGVRLW